VFYVKKGRCFLFLIKRKTLSCYESYFFLLTGINFPLTNFPYDCQTWENKENGFQEFVFLETNKAEVKFSINKILKNEIRKESFNKKGI